MTVTLDEKLGLEPARDRVVSIAGAGGKTTLMFALARSRAREGYTAAVMTTTHILCPKPSETLAVVTGGPQEAARAFSQGKLVAAGSPDAECFKMTAPAGETMQYLLDHAQALIIEADGSKRLPIKFPNDTEPVLLPQTNRVVVVAGLSALGRPLGEICHRAPLACERLGLSPREPVTPPVTGGPQEAARAFSQGKLVAAGDRASCDRGICPLSADCTAQPGGYTGAPARGRGNCGAASRRI